MPQRGAPPGWIRRQPCATSSSINTAYCNQLILSGLRSAMTKSIFRVFNRLRRYDDLSVSIQEHIEEKIEDLVEGGMARPQAEKAARREFGNVGLIQQRSREVWQWPALESIMA